MIFRIFPVMAFGLFVTLTAPAFAFESNASTAQEKAALQGFGTTFKPVAQSFGCEALAKAKVLEQGTIMQLEYVPAGGNIASSPKVCSMTVYLLTGDAQSDQSLMVTTQETIVNNYMKLGKVLNVATADNASGEPETYFEYVGEKASGAAVFMRSTAETAALMQIKSRGGIIGADDIAKVKAMLPNATPHEQPAAETEGAAE